MLSEIRRTALLIACMQPLYCDRASAIDTFSTVDYSSNGFEFIGSASERTEVMKAGRRLGVIGDFGKVLGQPSRMEKAIAAAEVGAERLIQGGINLATKNPAINLAARVGGAEYLGDALIGYTVRPMFRAYQEELKVRRIGDETYRIAEANTEAATFNQARMNIRYHEELRRQGVKYSQPKGDVLTSPSGNTQIYVPKSEAVIAGRANAVISPNFTGQPFRSANETTNNNTAQLPLSASSASGPKWGELTANSTPKSSNPSKKAISLNDLPDSRASPVPPAHAGSASAKPAPTAPVTPESMKDAGGVRTGSSKPEVSATALPEGGIRVAPPAPNLSPDANRTTTQLVREADGGVRTESQKPAVSATASPEGGVRVAPSAPSTRPDAKVLSSIPTASGSTPSSAATRTATRTSPTTPSQNSNTGNGTPYRIAMGSPAANPIQTAPRISGPGGISLSRAAADKLSLNIDFEGASFSSGRIVLSGQPQPKGIDAAIFLTSLRVACEAGDPSFSLDPDNGKEWSDEGQKLSQLLSERLRARIRRNQSGSSPFAVHIFSGSTELKGSWAKLLSEHPNFKTRLVFRPEWLKETRFGEVLYKADVLLKELSIGAPLLQLDPKLRANAVDGYMPTGKRRAARYLLETIEQGSKNATTDVQWQGNRLWFDLVAQAETAGGPQKSSNTDSVAFSTPRTSAGQALYNKLRQLRYVEANDKVTPVKASTLSENGTSIDLSQVFPQMFIRRHDHASGKDLPGSDPDLDVLSADVNRRTKLYASAYTELQELTDLFRAYIVASKYAKRYPGVCDEVSSLPLLEPEKPLRELPEHHPSELHLTVATFGYGGHWRAASSSSVSGGISLRGKLYAEQSTAYQQPTLITTELEREVESNREQTSWRANSGRQFVALKVGADDWIAPPPKALTAPVIDTPLPSGTIERFDIFQGARISGNRIKSSSLQKSHLSDPRAAVEECVQLCSSDSNCVAFEIDQTKNQCNGYSTVSKAVRDPNWLHGVWK